ncbi:MAG: hypothetical protein HOQ45_02985 [Nocardioidaceae bacterium]|nr:hypothetical protein [Nocardioidaceae bacterium]
MAAGVAALTTLLVAVPLSSMADQVAVDGDGVDPSNSKNSQFELCSGVGSAVDVFATLTYQGSQHFANNGTVTITANVPAAASGFLSAAGATVTTASWNNSQDKVTTPAMPLTVGGNWTAGQYTVTYTITGKDTAGSEYVLEDKNNVQISAKTTGCGTGGGGEQNPPENTAPVVNVTGFNDGATYEIGTTIDPGCQVDDAEDTGESATPQITGPVGPLSAYGLGVVTVSCSYVDGGGLSGTDEASYTIDDTGAPVITDLGPTATPDGKNGWYIHEVTNQFHAADTGAGFPTLMPPLLTMDWTVPTDDQQGSAVTVSSGTVTDVAGNTADAIDSAPFKIDLSDPQLHVSGAPSGSYDLCTAGLPTRPTFNPDDAISGLDGTENDTWTTPSTATGVGAYTYAATATDNAGRTTTETRSFTSVYGAAYTGITQPINGGATATLADDDSRFKLGSTVPVKFALTCAGKPVAGAVAKLTVKKADGTPDPGTAEAVSTAASTTGNLFRYDATAGQYIFNLSTKNGYTNPGGATVTFTAGTYTLSVLLDDGSYHSVNIQIVK